jgi:hypothetical protein
MTCTKLLGSIFHGHSSVNANTWGNEDQNGHPQHVNGFDYICVPLKLASIKPIQKPEVVEVGANIPNGVERGDSTCVACRR